MKSIDNATAAVVSVVKPSGTATALFASSPLIVFAVAAVSPAEAITAWMSSIWTFVAGSATLLSSGRSVSTIGWFIATPKK